MEAMLQKATFGMQQWRPQPSKFKQARKKVAGAMCNSRVMRLSICRIIMDDFQTLEDKFDVRMNG